MAKTQKEKDNTSIEEAEELGRQLAKAEFNAKSTEAYLNYCKKIISFSEAQKMISEDISDLDNLRTKIKLLAGQSGATDAFFLMHYFDIKDQLKEAHDTQNDLIEKAYDNGDLKLGKLQ
jgi:hypothetical protein